MPTPIESINGRTRRTEFEATAQADQFEHWFKKEHPGKFPDRRVDLLFGDLKAGRFWTPLSLLDGPAKGGLLNPYGAGNASEGAYEQARLEARTWTLDTFTKPEIDTLFDLVINLALEPERITAPGYQRGHSTLLSHMVDKPGSLFAAEVTPEGRRRLVNGAFWEELGYAVGGAPGRVNDILVNHASELDSSLAANGVLHLYGRNRNLTTIGREKIDIEMDGFSTKALDTYLGFIDKVAKEIAIDGEPAVLDETIDQLVTPYILAIIALDPENDSDLRFGPQYDDEKGEYVIPTDSYHARLQHPLVQQALVRSERNRRIFGDKLAGLLTEPDVYGDVALDVIEAISAETSDKVLQVTLNQIGDFAIGEIEYLLNSSNSSLTDRGLELLGSRTPQDQEE